MLKMADTYQVLLFFLLVILSGKKFHTNAIAIRDFIHHRETIPGSVFCLMLYHLTRLIAEVWKLKNVNLGIIKFQLHEEIFSMYHEIIWCEFVVITSQIKDCQNRDLSYDKQYENN